MRWGILVNLGVILAVSGILLFVVFGVSTGTRGRRLKIQQAGVIVDLLQGQILNSDSAEHLWDGSPKCV